MNLVVKCYQRMHIFLGELKSLYFFFIIHLSITVELVRLKQFNVSIMSCLPSVDQHLVMIQLSNLSIISQPSSQL